MRIAYLILAHDSPNVLARAISQLSSDNCTFFVHVDRKSDIADFSAIRGANVHFCEPRIPVYWGDFSQVQAILRLIQTAIASVCVPDYCVLISGSDYPLRSGHYIHDFLEANNGSEFINLVKVPAPGKPLSRINTLRYPRSRPLRHFASRVAAKIGLGSRDYRKFLGDLEPYSGSTWWCLSSGACRYVLDFLEHNPRFVSFFENVFAVDEAFFQTILGNSHFRRSIRRNLHYEDWSEGGSHPALIDERHVEVFEGAAKVYMKDDFGNAEVLFARKFSGSNSLVLDRIDRMIAMASGSRV